MKIAKNDLMYIGGYTPVTIDTGMVYRMSTDSRELSYYFENGDGTIELSDLGCNYKQSRFRYRAFKQI